MFKKTLLAASIAATAALAFAPAASAQNSTANLRVFGLTADNTLISFTTAAPRLSSRVVGTITGTLPADSEIVGIDFRVQDGGLYAVGRGGGVYLIDTGNATATFVNQLNVGGAPLALEGTRFGVDFNPAADRLRIVSDTGQNLRHNVNAGGVTIVDGVLNNGAVPPATVAGIAAAAYTNNDDAVAATGTVLFDINAAAGTLLVQIPPNSGGTSLIGSLGVTDISGGVGFDIYTVTNRAGASVSNIGFASIAGASGASQLYSVDLSTGVASALGQMRTVAPIVDIALPIAQ